MASSPPLPPPSLPHPNNKLNIKSTINTLFNSFFHRQRCIRARVQCQLNSSDNGAHHQNYNKHQQWTVDCVTGSDPIHIILKPPVVNSPMTLNSPGLKNSKKVCLFYAAEMEALAQRIAAQSDAIELRAINWRYIFYDYQY